MVLGLFMDARLLDGASRGGRKYVIASHHIVRELSRKYHVPNPGLFYCFGPYPGAYGRAVWKAHCTGAPGFKYTPSTWIREKSAV